MHIDHDNLAVGNESDVEQKIIMPLLVGSAYLDISQHYIFTKNYLAPTALDKSADKTTGYYPDYSVWMRGFPILVVEAKAPDVPSEVGYREASLYARHLNQDYASDFNPCRFIISVNGKDLLFGHWDSQPVLTISVPDIRPGSSQLAELLKHCHSKILDGFALECAIRARASHSYYPYSLADGPALLNARRPPNSFAAELSPLLRRYFFSSN
jgi:type I site-specific restriction endonuclease